MPKKKIQNSRRRCNKYNPIKKNSYYNTATPFVADREPTASYAGGTSPLTLSCPETNLSYNELDLIIASLRRGCLNDAIVGDDARFIELVSAADAPESDERLEMTAASVVVIVEVGEVAE